MVKNVIKYIFIYIICIGCENSVTCVDDCYIETSAPSLQMDENGYYHIEWLDGYVQTFSTLKVDTGIEHQKINWVSDTEINITHNGQDNWTNVVNGHSYTDNEGAAYTVIGIWEELVGDTIKVYCGYVSECNIQYIDSLGVIINER